MDPEDILPFEIWLRIAQFNPQCWCLLIITIKCLGIYALDAMVQIRMRNHFIFDKVEKDRDRTFIMSVLPNGLMHGDYMVYDEIKHVIVESGYCVLGEKHGMVRVNTEDETKEILYVNGRILIQFGGSIRQDSRTGHLVTTKYFEEFMYSFSITAQNRYAIISKDDLSFRCNQIYFKIGISRQNIRYKYVPLTDTVYSVVENCDINGQFHGETFDISSGQPLQKINVQNFYHGKLLEENIANGYLKNLYNYLTSYLF